MPTISACLMVKNEFSMLSGCLDSILKHVDEIIIFDTGSTDGTVEKILMHRTIHGDKIKLFEEPWEDDFGAMRTKTLKPASGHWILCIDADERLEPSFSELVSYLGFVSPKIVGFQLGIVSEVPGGVKSESKQIRIFRNFMGFRFVNPVHNQLVYHGGIQDLSGTIKINHLGYNLSPERMREKYLARVLILEKEKAKDAKNPVTRYHLAKMYVQGKELDLARIEAREAIELLRNLQGFDFKGTPFDCLFQIAGIERGE